MQWSSARSPRPVDFRRAIHRQRRRVLDLDPVRASAVTIGAISPCSKGATNIPSGRRADTRFYGLNYNIPSLCFGASGAAMHGFNEYVDLDSLRKSTKATALFIAEWCGVEAI